jgi:N-acetylglucosaminyldiphosphoundecaprenol N-acetyl-beta-D-mannosaminyltransferase
MDKNNKVRVGGVCFSNFNLNEAVSSIQNKIREAEPFFALPFNLRHLKRFESNDRTLNKIISKAEYIFADGMPIVWASKIAGRPLPGRVTGCDLGKALIEASNSLKIFLLATNDDGSLEIGEKAAKKFSNLGLNTKGTTQKYEDTLKGIVPEEIDSILRNWRPDIVMVGLGGNEQEEWILENQLKYQIPFCMGVGGSIDIWADFRKRAPRWMQNAGLEWLYQVINSPKKIKRCLKLLPVFVRLMFSSFKKRFNYEK